jgi:hypothetical protein
MRSAAGRFPRVTLFPGRDGGGFASGREQSMAKPRKRTESVRSRLNAVKTLNPVVP